MDLVGRFDSKGIRWCIFVKVLSQVKDILYCNLYIGRNEQYIIAIIASNIVCLRVGRVYMIN